MDPNLRKLAAEAHRGEAKIKTNFARPVLAVHTTAGEISGFIHSCKEYAEYMKSSFDWTNEQLPEGEYLFLGMMVNVDITCVRVDQVAAWELKRR